MLRKTACLALLSVTFTHAAADDWPQFLGPNRDAVSTEGRVATEWPADGPKVAWSKPVGPGFGGAAIRDGQAFFLDRNDDEGDALRVFDLKTGKELWRYDYKAEGKLSYHGSRSTPTVTDTHIYTVGGFGDVHCIDRKTQKPVWKLNLTKRYTFDNLKWGHAQSPLVYGDTVILSPTHHDTPLLVALNNKSGAVVWESEKPNMKQEAGKDAYASDYYSSPTLRTVAGREGILHITNHQVTFVDPKTGKTIWKYTGYSIKFAIPAPTVLPSTDGGKSNRIFVTGGYDDGSVMIRVSQSGDGYRVDELWRPMTEGKPDGSQLHPAVYYKGHLYVNINENSKFRRSARLRGGLACINPDTGKILWRTGDEPFLSRGNVIRVGDHLLVQDGELGNLHLVAPSPKGFKELAKAKVLDALQKKAWAPMAFADGYLIMRDQTTVKCLDLRTPKSVSR